MSDREIKVLRDLKARHQLTQRQMAKHCGIDETKMSRVMNGGRRLAGEELIRLYEALGISPTDRVIRMFTTASFTTKRGKKDGDGS